FFSSRRRHTRSYGDWSSDVCSSDLVVIFVHSGRVGVIIGKKGQEIDKLTSELEGLTGRHVEIKTMEVNRPEIDAQLVAEDIAGQDRKSTRLNSSHRTISYAVFCLKK